MHDGVKARTRQMFPFLPLTPVYDLDLRGMSLGLYRDTSS